MTTRFKDEWILRAVGTLPGCAAAAERLRGKSTTLAEGLLRDKLATAEQIGKAVEAAHNVRWIDPAPETIERMAVSLVPERLCRRHQALPLRLEGETLELAMANPLDLDALADLQAVSGRQPVPCYCLPERLDTLINDVYKPEAVVYDLLEHIEETASVEVLEGASYEDQGEDDAVRAPVAKLVNALIARAVRLRASDIHIEHEERASHVRFRVDGGLRAIMTLPRHIGTGAVVSRVKIMADLDIADHMRPQDGRAKLKVGDLEVGLRVSTLPTNFGEKVVMRLLDPRSAAVPFEALGFREEISQRIRERCAASQGIVLVTGPTGSGKTTTLYSLLNALKAPDTNITTVEDPVEYKLEGINQVQVREKQGLTFAAVLRSVLRQDPDVILVGEVRDRETADTAFQAALTGHLVLTTLHTNDTVSSLTRLLDMGVERFKVAPGLLAVTAQRLARRLCAECRKPVPDAELPSSLRAALRSFKLPEKAWAAGGCPKCEGSGFAGRLLLVELLDVDAPLRELIAGGAGEAELRRAALQSGALFSMLGESLRRVCQGDTTLEEVLPYIRLDAAEPEAPSAAPAPEPRAAAPAKPASAPAPEGGVRVLLADDDKAIRLILRKTFQAEGWTVVEAEDGEQALERAAEGGFDMLVLDLGMPKLDGYGVIKGLRDGLGLLDLPILILTASSDEKSEETALSLGADDFVAKPFKPAVVAARVKAALRRRAVRA